MSSEQLLVVLFMLGLVAALAVVALAAAFVAVRAARRAAPAPKKTPTISPVPPTSTQIIPIGSSSAVPAERVAHVVEGRVIVAPTSRQIVDVTMSRPLVRISVLSHGLAHALRPESRDRIVALMRREFQSRRRLRKRAAKQAARLEHPNPQRAIDRATISTEAWLGELPAHQKNSAPHNTAVDS